MSRYVRHVEPTGNSTSDTTNIQNAIDFLTTTELGKDSGVVILAGGTYYINDTLTFGNIGTRSNPYGGDDENPPRMIGAATAHLSWVGGSSEDTYMIVYSGVSREYEPGAYLQNLMLWGNNKCRGIRVHRATYASALRDIEMRQMEKVGVDLIDCWGSECRNINITGMDGIAMRMQGGGTMLLHHIDFQGTATNFPSASETLFWNYEGTYVQTAESERAGLVIKMGQVNGELITPENYDGNDYPGIFISGNDCHLQGIRWEGCDNNDCRVLIDSANNVSLSNMSPGTGCPYLVRATGECQGIHISKLESTAKTGILCLDGGTHSGHIVSDIGYNHAYFHSPHNYIVQINSPSLSGEPSADNSRRVSLPWQ